MAGYLKKVEVDKFETQQINTQINSKILEDFQKKLKQKSIPMNVVLTVFAEQYASGKYHLNAIDILKWNNDNRQTSTLNTPINKEIYNRFKMVAKLNGFFVRSVLSAFIEDYAKNDLIMGFVNRYPEKTNKNK